MFDVFISYSHKDQEVVKKIIACLEGEGFSVDWDDSFQIAMGATLFDLLDKRCKTATCVLVLWSKSSIQSKWVKREADVGMERHRLLQVTLDGTTPPLIFQDYIYGSLENWDGVSSDHEFQRIVKGIHFFQERSRA